MIDPASVAFFIPGHLRAAKLDLFNRVAKSIEAKGGRTVRADFDKLARVAEDHTPIVGCTPELRPLIDDWKKRGKAWIYWDRGYVRRVMAAALPRGTNGGYYRFHVGCYQAQKIRDVPDDRWRSLRTDVQPWKRKGRHIVIAAPSLTYSRFHRCENWIAETINALARSTDRQLVIRDKEHVRNRPLQADLDGAHALVTHGSIAAVESVVLGCPVFVHPDSAAALVGQTDLSKIEQPVYPERQPFLNTLAYDQFSEQELCDGTLWRLIG